MISRSIPIGRLFGIELRVDWSWLLVAALMTTSLTSLFSGWHPAWAATLSVMTAAVAAVLFFASVLAHELSHALVARAFAVPVRHITLFLFGGVATIGGEPPSPKAELLIAGAGPLVSVAIGVLATALGVVCAGDAFARVSSPADVGAVMATLAPVPTLLLWLGPVNLSVALFNLIPGFPLDGGRVLRALLWKATGDLADATRATSLLGQVVGWGFITLGLMMAIGTPVPLFGRGLASGVWLAAVGWFLRSAAVGAYEHVAVEQALAGLRVQHWMRRPGPVVSADTPVREVVTGWMLPGGADAIPVVDGDYFVGVVRLERLRDLPVGVWDTCSARLAVDHQAVTLSPGDSLSAAFRRLLQMDADALPVVENGRLVGVLHTHDIVRWLETRASARGLAFAP